MITHQTKTTTKTIRELPHFTTIMTVFQKHETVQENKRYMAKKQPLPRTKAISRDSGTTAMTSRMFWTEVRPMTDIL